MSARTHQQTRGALRLVLLLGVLACGGGFLWWRTQTAAPPAGVASTRVVPSVQVADLELPVQEILGESRRTVISRPRSAEAWGWYAAVLDAHHFYAEAEICYRRAHELDPADKRYSYNLAILLETLGSGPEESLVLLREVERIEPKFPPLHVRIAHNLARKGELESAADSYRTAIALDPKLWIARRSLARILIELGDFEHARQELESVAAAVASDGPTHAALAQAYAGVGSGERAAAAAARAQGLDDVLLLPDPLQFLVLQQGRSARLVNERVQARIADGDYAGALEDLKIVLRTRAGDPKVHERLAEVYAHLGQQPQANAELAEARRLRNGK